MNAIRRPSGDQLGDTSRLSVKRSGADPSAFMTKISGRLSTKSTNAICDPSGDQLGADPFASRISPDPSGLIL